MLALALVSCSKPELPELELFAKQGVSLKIPKNWSESSDQRLSPQHRQLRLISDDHMSLTIDIFRRPGPDIDPFFAEQLRSTVAPHSLAHPNITQGNAQRKRSLGYYAVIDIETAPAIALFMETLIIENDQTLAYLSFSSPLTQRTALKKIIEPTLNSFKIRSL